ncbi:MAG: endonuclease Q family protein, partial [Defluviitaleaceae bacterium]|nr:endonuclease Q family protein [Defluviitaleaceae bacterium]
SDAHSPGKLAREANIFNTELSYPAMAAALATPDSDAFHGTLEFFPEEGKYHFDGHRACGVRLSPAETLALGGVCPVCSGRITTGVLHRVEELADRPEGYVSPGGPRYESLAPLPEIIRAATGHSQASRKGRALYDGLMENVGNELYVLREAEIEEIEKAAGPLMAVGVRKVRAGEVALEPGFDGEYGTIRLR